MQKIRSLKEADVRGKRVLVRIDSNAPLDHSAGTPLIKDDSRLRAAVPTLQYLHEQGAHVVVAGSIGRPDGLAVEDLRMAPVAARLKELAGFDMEVLENLRFDPREEANDESFARELAGLGDVFVNEAFADSHRAHASIVGIPKFLPSYAGLCFEKEIEHLSRALTPPAGSIAFVGGVKFETKVPLLLKLSETYERVFLGGALENDVLRARGTPVGISIVSQSPAPVEVAGNEKIYVPHDVVVRAQGAVEGRNAFAADVRIKEEIVDIGVDTAAQWAEEIMRAPLVLWNGPLGMYESGFVQGTDAVAAAIAKRSASADAGEFSAIIGGGDTLAAVGKTNFDPERVFLSTGGGAMLEFLADGTLPGLEALQKQV